MKRFHLFEFNDQTWLPSLFRNFLTDILQFYVTNEKVFQGAVPIINEILRKTGHKTVVDLCSGASGPWLSMADQLLAEAGKPVEIFLTDKYPNETLEQVVKKSPHKNLKFVETPVDVLDVPPDLKGIRTIFSGFHHLKPEQAREVLRNAVEQDAPICIFEFTERVFGKMLSMLLFSPFVAWILTLRIRPFTFARFFWTFILPVVPLIYWWDGVVSYLRTYTQEELREFISEFTDAYFWQIERIKPQGGAPSLSCLTGYPTPAIPQKISQNS